MLRFWPLPDYTTCSYSLVEGETASSRDYSCKYKFHYNYSQYGILQLI